LIGEISFIIQLYLQAVGFGEKCSSTSSKERWQLRRRDGSYGEEMAATKERWQLRRRDGSYGREIAATAERSQQRRRDGSSGGEMAATAGL